ncbi:MAG: hypothetical protein ACXADH_07490 [Candidatus Kariarchaeaceae archaeon]
MAPEVRSVLRKIDQLFVQGDFNQASELGISSIKECDASREYENSIAILQKLVEYANQNQENNLNKEQFEAHLIIRYLFMGKIEEVQALEEKQKDELTTPISKIAHSLLQARISESDSTYILEGIERQNIFGEFEQMKNLPFILFNDEEEAIQILEDYFDNGRYVINLINTTTSLHHSLNFDVGSAQDVNVVENRRIFRTK